MKKLLAITMLISVLMGCKSRYSTDSEEIELVKSASEAYSSRDWETLKDFYADTARIYHNVWIDGPGMTRDEMIESYKEGLKDYSEYRFEEEIWEMVINDEGEKWVHFWGLWEGIHKPSNENVITPVHISSLVKDGRIVWEGAIYNPLAGCMLKPSPDRFKPGLKHPNLEMSLERRGDSLKVSYTIVEYTPCPTCPPYCQELLYHLGDDMTTFVTDSTPFGGITRIIIK